MKISLYETIRDGAPWQPVELPKEGRVGSPMLNINRSEKRQRFLGVGSDVNGCTCHNLLSLPQDERRQALETLFSLEKGAGFSVVRDDIGASDFCFERYSLAEQPGDTELTYFDFSREDRVTVPALREIQAVTPDLFVMASPWSPPAWMKSTGSMVGPAGKLLRKYYGPYAKYLARYVAEMGKRGVAVSALTTQNEPRADHGGEKPMPQCVWTAEEEAAFIRDYLAPELDQARMDTEIWIFDHNWSMPRYPDKMLRDPQVRKRVSGIAWHHYYGNPRAMERIAEAWPGIAQHVTEGQIGGFAREGYHGGTSLCETLRRGASSYICWVTLLDEQGGPGEGPFIYRRDPSVNRTFDILLWDRATGKVHVNEAVWFLGHVGRYVRRGARRLISDDFLTNVAFENPDGSVVLVVENNRVGASERCFTVELDGERYSAKIPAYAVQTYVFTK